jgi:UPF0755 protein
MSKKVFKFLKKMMIFAVLLVPFVAVLVIDYFRVPVLNKQTERVSLVIPHGTSINTIVDSLFMKGLIDDKELFILWLTTMDKDRAIKAGFYEIPKGLTYAQLVTFLSQAISKEIKVTLVEGWRTEEIAAELAEKLQINEQKFIDLTRDSAFINSLSIAETSLEGYLLPDTYHFYWGVREEKIIEFLVHKCLSLFTDSVMTRLDSMKLTVHEILTLSSIVEGEAIYDDERAIVASVYHNRLRKRIKLQADPTIQYILDGPPRRLLFKDLAIDSPYNTYKYYGLPPGPISNPGKNSIIATIYPAKTDYIYFVARGDGRHTFSRNAAEHQHAKEQFDQVRREVNRQRKSSNLKRESQ